jgi:aconitate hydratase
MAKTLQQNLKPTSSGELVSGKEIAISVDHALLQDATGTMVMLEFIAMGVPVKVELAAQYVDRNLRRQIIGMPMTMSFMTAARKSAFTCPNRVTVYPPGTWSVSAYPARCCWGDPPPTAAGYYAIIGAGGPDVALAMAGRPFT